MALAVLIFSEGFDHDITYHHSLQLVDSDLNQWPPSLKQYHKIQKMLPKDRLHKVLHFQSLEGLDSQWNKAESLCVWLWKSTFHRINVDLSRNDTMYLFCSRLDLWLRNHCLHSKIWNNLCSPIHLDYSVTSDVDFDGAEEML